MRRTAVLRVEYARENGRPLSPEDWQRIIREDITIQAVRVEVERDE